MLKPKQRQSQILQALADRGEITVEALAQQFSVSSETVRRDLVLLAESGRLRKVHGGARCIGLYTEGSFSQRMSEFVEAKTLIAKKLATLIEPGATLFIDTGSTTLCCAHALSTIEGLTIITNSLKIAQVLGATDSKVHLLGGKFDVDNDETVGPQAIRHIAQFQADYAILSAAAVDADAGVMDSSFEEAQVAIAMANFSNEVIVLADASKLKRRAAFRVCGFDQVDMLVCDVPPDGYIRAALLQYDVRLH